MNINWEAVQTKDDKLNLVKENALVSLLATMETERGKIITPLSGQETVYAIQLEEGQRYLALAKAPKTLDDFPMLEKQVGVTVGTASELAQLWVTRSRETASRLADLEVIRQSVSQAIKNAKTDSDVSHALEVLGQAVTAE